LDKFKEASSAEDVETAHQLATEGQRYMKEAHKKLQEANKLLRNIILSIKQAGGGEELTAPEDEVEEEVEEETENEIECEIEADCIDSGKCIEGLECTCSENKCYQGFVGNPNEGNATTESYCGDGRCAEIVCLAIGCPLPETAENCPADCAVKDGSACVEEEGETKTIEYTCPNDSSVWSECNCEDGLWECVGSPETLCT